MLAERHLALCQALNQLSCQSPEELTEGGRGEGYYSQWTDGEAEAQRAKTQTLEPVLFLVPLPTVLNGRKARIIFVSIVNEK